MPNGWVEASLGEVAQWGAGGTPDRSQQRYFGGTIPWIKSGELNARLVLQTEESITEEALRESSAKLFPAGSVAIAMYGATIGKVAVLGVDAATNQACAVGQPNPDILHRDFFYRLLQNEKLAFIANGKGGAQPNISQAVIKAHRIKLPPLAEQKRIAQKLDELLAQVDTIKARVDAIPAFIKRFQDSVLTLATDGRLTESWRSRDARNSHGWESVRLAEVANDFSYGSASKSAKSGDVPVLRMGNIQGRRLDWSELVYTSNKQEIAKYKLENGDVLFNRTNSPELVGKTAVFKGDREAIYAGYLIRVKCSPKLLPDYLNYCLGSPAGRAYCWQVKSDGVSQSNINAKKLAAFEFGLPPIDEQIEIVTRVEKLFAMASQMEAKVDAAKRRIDQLTQSILAKAFRGELLPQDPNDEPASALLESIRTQRSVAAKPSRGRAKN